MLNVGLTICGCKGSVARVTHTGAGDKIIKEEKLLGSKSDERSSLSTGSEMLYRFENQELFRTLCGVSDVGVSELSSLLHVELIPRGHTFYIRTSNERKMELAIQFFHSIEKRYGTKGSPLPDSFDYHYLYDSLHKKKDKHSEQENRSDESELLTSTPTDNDDLQKKIFTNFRGRVIYPKTKNQARYVQSIFDNVITITLGPAGTGKTFLSVAAACQLLTQGAVERIILTRPAVEAGESLGFLPGDLAQKVDPYLRPIYDALYECLGMERVNEMIDSRRIEIAPLAYMRGRTLSHSIVILDEAQNCTFSQLKMFLTRLGKNSKICLGGDVTQIDLGPGKSGLTKVISILKKIQGIGVVEFGKEDIIRNPMVEKIVRAFEEHGRDS